jgi:hypothetical protein
MFSSKSGHLDVELDHKRSIETLWSGMKSIVWARVYSTYPEYTYDYEKDDLEEMPISVIGNLKQDKFAGPEGIHCLDGVSQRGANRKSKNTHRKCHCSDQRAKEASPHSLDTKRVTHFLKHSSQSTREQWQCLTHTSMENITPPIGEPKATATPAADAAVKISRILPCQGPLSVMQGEGRNKRHTLTP